MTINDILDAVISMEGKIEVRAYTDEVNYKSETKLPWESITKVSEEKRSMEILYIYSTGDEIHGNKMVIEVNGETE